MHICFRCFFSLSILHICCYLLKLVRCRTEGHRTIWSYATDSEFESNADLSLIRRENSFTLLLFYWFVAAQNDWNRYAWLLLAAEQQLTICAWSVMIEHAQIVGCCSAANNNHASGSQVNNGNYYMGFQLTSTAMTRKNVYAVLIKGATVGSCQLEKVKVRI